MSKTKEVTVSLTRLIQTAPYESLQFSISETLEISSKDDIEKIKSKKIDELTELISKKEKSIRKEHKSK